MKYLHGRSKSFEHGGRVKNEVWVVPKANFPDGLPANVAASQVSKDDLAELQLVGGCDVDGDMYYFIDQECPRKFLGKQVLTLEFFSASTTRLALDRSDSWWVAASSTTAASSVAASSQAAQRKVKAEAALPHKLREAEGQVGLKRRQSDASSDEEPELKQARQLAQLAGWPCSCCERGAVGQHPRFEPGDSRHPGLGGNVGVDGY